MSEGNRTATDRRGFLRFAGLGSVVGAATLLMKGREAEAAEPRPDVHAGYRETQHVKTFYETARF